VACARTTTTTAIRILIVDDARSVRRALRHIFATEPDFVVIGEAADGTSAVAMAATLHPDIIVMDSVMPGITGIEAARRIRAGGDAGKVIMLTAFGGDEAGAIADAGIALILEKSDTLNDLADRIRDVHGRGASH